MAIRKFAGIAFGMIVPGAVFLSTIAFATVAPTQGPAQNGSPGWHIQHGSPDPLGRGATVDAEGNVTVAPRPAGGRGAGAPAGAPGNGAAAVPRTPGCSRSTVCTRKGGPSRQETDRVTWDQTLGYTFSYPDRVPPGDGGIPAVALDSKDNVWAMQRSPMGSPQLFKFDKNAKLVLTVGPDVTGYLEKAHGMAVDSHDNVWITDTNGETVQQISPDGKLLRTIGVKDKRGDWDEAKGQHLLWQPDAIAFAANGDFYIGEGHGNESPNDTDSDDPADVIGASRVLHFDKDGKFINQWFGDDVGPGKFEMIHSIVVDPTTGDIWLADREQYRIVIYTAEGKFLRTIQMRNLVCALNFDAQGNPWMASGQEGQVLKIDRDGKVLGAIGGGMGIDRGKFIEAAFFGFDKAGNIYVGDTSVGRIAKLSPPKK